MIELTEIARQASAVMARRGIRPGMLWVGVAVGVEVYRLVADPALIHGYRAVQMGIDEPEVFGMRLNTDEWLPPDVWRLADEHGTLLYDCREGKVVP